MGTAAPVAFHPACAPPGERGRVTASPGDSGHLSGGIRELSGLCAQRPPGLCQTGLLAAPHQNTQWLRVSSTQLVSALGCRRWYHQGAPQLCLNC